MTSYIIITAIFMLLILVEFGIENNSYSTSTVVKCGNFTFSSQGFFVFIFIAICIFLMSMRGINVGNDTYDYYITFEKVAKYGVESVSRIEKGYLYFNYLISYLGGSYRTLLIVSSIFMYSVTGYFFFRKSTNAPIALMIFYFIGFVSLSSATRQGIAVAFTIIAYFFLERNKYIKFGFFVIVGALFHSSALCALLLLPFYKINFTYKRGAIAILIVISATILHIPNSVISQIDSYSWYAEVSSGALAVIFNSLQGIAYLVIGVNNYYKVSQSADTITDMSSVLVNENCSADANNAIYYINDNKSKNCYSLMAWSTVAFVCLNIMSIESGIFGRATYYFIPYMIIFASNAFDEEMPATEKIFYSCAIFALLFLYNVLALIYRPEWNSFFPFYFFWN